MQKIFKIIHYLFDYDDSPFSFRLINCSRRM